MKEKLIRYIRAGYAGLYLVSHEEQRVEAEFKAVADELKYNLFAWSVTAGLIDTKDGASRGAQDPMEALGALNELPENSITLLRDFHLFFDDPNPMLIRQLKDLIRRGKASLRTIAVLGCRLKLPPELERDFTVIEFALPGEPELRQVLTGIVESTGRTMPSAEAAAALIDAARGMTTTEAEDAFSLSVIESDALTPAVVAREKAQAVKKNGLLELVEKTESFESIGGLDLLKEWLLKRREAFTPRAAKYGLPSPKGLLIVGIPGCGKSLTAKATASVFGVPLLRLDAGRIFAGLVGQSESNFGPSSRRLRPSRPVSSGSMNWRRDSRAAKVPALPMVALRRACSVRSCPGCRRRAPRSSSWRPPTT
jgi:ATPase family associated with various cellular activities (AAA)